jgi:hypothetical protein
MIIIIYFIYFVCILVSEKTLKIRRFIVNLKKNIQSENNVINNNIIIIDDIERVIKTLLQWAKDANKFDLIKDPRIQIENEW